MKHLSILFLFVFSQLVIADCPGLPESTIHWIVPNKPGGGYDAYSRLLQPFLEKQLGARILVENRSGAGGVIGAMAIADARADGTTLGIINAPGLLAANLVARGPAPHPGRDFTIIGRLATTHVVMFTGRDSGISNIDDLIQVSSTRPVLVGVHDAGSAIFVALPVTAALIGMNYELVTGYNGNTARTMAALRGEVDVVFNNFDSARRYVAAGELIPLLQITDPAMSEMDSDTRSLLDGVPVLAGSQGFAVQQTEVTGQTKSEAVSQAAALDNIYAAGRLIVAPPNLPEPLSQCLDSTLTNIVDSVEFQAAANRAGLNINHSDRETVKVNLIKADDKLQQFQPEVMAAIKRARG